MKSISKEDKVSVEKIYKIEDLHGLIKNDSAFFRLLKFILNWAGSKKRQAYLDTFKEKLIKNIFKSLDLIAQLLNLLCSKNQFLEE